MQAILPCPIDVGRLSACYFGSWFKNMTKVAEVQSPTGEHCSNPGSVNSFPRGNYSVDVKNSFSLTIISATPADTGDDYICELLSINPATSLGNTVFIGNSSAAPFKLSVGGKLVICHWT